MGKKPILLQAAPFCYGPISTMLNVARVLTQFDYHLVIIDEGPTGELIRRSGLNIECLKTSTLVPFSDELVNAIDRADFVISNTDPIFAAACMDHGAKVVVIDTLFWMWDQFDIRLLECDLYIVQNFYGIDEQIRRLGKPKNFARVGPLISSQNGTTPSGQRENLVHISLGGCDCMFVDPNEDPYPTMILELIEDCLKNITATKLQIILTTGERTACSLKPQNEHIKISTLSNEAHLRIMHQAQAALLSPGLTGTMEVFEAETPIFFLPPQNYSQVLQLNAYRKASAAPYSFNWSDVYPEFDLLPYLPEEEAVNSVREIIQRFVKDDTAKGVLCQRLRAFLGEGLQNYDPAPGKRVRQSLGMNGPYKAAYAINTLLTQN